MSKITPSLESITIRAKYILEENDFSKVAKKLKEELTKRQWIVKSSLGESVVLFDLGENSIVVLATNKKDLEKIWHKTIKRTRYGIPLSFSMTAIEHPANGLLVEVECKPSMWFKITTLLEKNFTQNNIEEALQECQEFVRQTMSMFGGRIVEPPSVYPYHSTHRNQEQITESGTFGHSEKSRQG